MKLSMRYIILSLILSITIGLVMVILFTSAVDATEELFYTEPTADSIAPTQNEETSTTPPETTAEEETTTPTEFHLEDILFDNTLQYYVFDDEAILISEIEKYNGYIQKLSEGILSYPNYTAEIEAEINRAIEIVEQYTIDLKFVNKGIFNVPDSYKIKDFKSYEDYRAITTKTSPHYKLQREYAVTGPEGIRMVDDRYCIALGSYFTTTIGQYVDIVLENGTIISCILGDQKSDAHTDELHIAHRSDGSIVEFIVDLDVLDSIPRRMGSISYVYEEWKSPVAQVIVYDFNFFDTINE